MNGMSRRAALRMLATGGAAAVGLGYVLRKIIDIPVSRAQPGMGGATGTDMRAYLNMFMRHRELRRSVEEIPGGVRTTTESESADLVAELHAHVSSMYAHLDEGSEVTCMSPT
ncbi:MAG: hypothetical protein ACSLE6_20805, partial [Mycobacterium sp.]